MQRPLGQAKKGVGHFSLLLPEPQKESRNTFNMLLMLYSNCECKKKVKNCEKLEIFDGFKIPGQFRSSEKSPQSLAPSHSQEGA